MSIIKITAEQEKQIKRINQRLAQMEKTGYKNSALYQSLITRITMSGLQTTKSRSGEIRLSRAKTQKSGMNHFTFSENLKYVESVPKLSEELRKARKKSYFPIGSTPKERVLAKSSFEERLEEHLSQMYDDAQRGNYYGEMLRNTAKGKGLRHETYDYLIKLMDEIDKTRSELIQENVPYQQTIFEEVQNYDYKTQQGRGIPSDWQSNHKTNRAKR